MRLCLALALVLSALTACGPNISEMRMVSAPPKPSTCELQFLALTINQVSPAAPEYEYEVLGHVMLFETGVQDPMQESYRAAVRPRACAMGGEAVAILQQSTNTGSLGSGSAVDYAVVRKRPPPGSRSLSEKF